MSTSKLMKVTYYDPKSQIRLLCYADTVVWDTKPTPTLTALRFGGYPERVQGLADAIYGGATIEIEDGMTGRLVADPELRRTQSGVSVTSFRIANDRDYGKGEEKETDFFDVVAWRSTAEFICKYFTKGRMISVDGRLQTRGWKDREGNNRVSIEILVDNAYFADSKKDDAAGDFPADDQFAGYGAYQGSVPGGGDDFAPDF